MNLFARFYAMAGIKGASSYSGRRQFLTKLADKGINVRVIQALARHKDISTTQRYIDYNESKLRNAIELAYLTGLLSAISRKTSRNYCHGTLESDAPLTLGHEAALIRFVTSHSHNVVNAAFEDQLGQRLLVCVLGLHAAHI